MKTKTKKWLLAVFFPLFVLIASLCFLSSCTQKKEVKLVDFNDMEVDAPLYGDFSVAGYIMTVDTDGNTYKGEATVFDPDGNPIELAFYRFEPTVLKPYTVTITVKVAADDIRTRTLTVNVKDMSRPRVEFSSDLYVGITGEAYVLPQVTATKLSNEPLTPVLKVYFLGASGEIAQTVTDGKFTPTEEGNYRLDVSIVDQYGTETLVSKTFSIRAAMAANVLEDFGHPQSAYNLGNTTLDGNTKGTWLEEFQGASGVVTATCAQSMNCWGGRFNRTEEELKTMLADFDYITVRLWVDWDSPDGKSTHLFEVFGFRREIAMKKWVDFVIPRENMLAWKGAASYATEEEKIAAIAAMFCSTGAGQWLYSPVAGGYNVPLYIDCIVIGDPESGPPRDPVTPEDPIRNDIYVKKDED